MHYNKTDKKNEMAKSISKMRIKMKDIKKCSSCSSFCFYILYILLNNKCIQFYELLFYYVGFFNLFRNNM